MRGPSVTREVKRRWENKHTNSPNQQRHLHHEVSLLRKHKAGSIRLCVLPDGLGHGHAPRMSADSRALQKTPWWAGTTSTPTTLVVTGMASAASLQTTRSVPHSPRALACPLQGHMSLGHSGGRRRRKDGEA